jgi:adenosine deaminase
VHELAGFEREDLLTVTRNAFDAAWIDEDLRRELHGKLDAYALAASGSGAVSSA